MRSALRQLYIMLWKNIFLKRFQRHYVTTILEIALMVAFMTGIHSNAVKREQLIRHSVTLYPPSSPMTYWRTLKNISNIQTVVFTPQTQYFAKLVRSATADLGIKTVLSSPTLQHLEETVKLNQNTTPSTLIGIFFDGDFTKDQTPPQSLDIVVYPTQLQLDTGVRFGDKLSTQAPGPNDESRYNEMNTILPITARLEYHHLMMTAQRKNVAFNADFKLRRFPYPSYIEERSQRNYGLVLTRFCVAMLIPFAVFVARLTEERGTGMKEMMRICGLSDWIYWISHFLGAFFILLIIVTMMMIFLTILRNKEGRTFIQYSDPLLLFYVLMAFSSSALLQAMFLSIFFSSPASAVAGSMLYWTFSCVLPFTLLEDPSGLGYYYITHDEKLLTSVFPGMNLHWCFRIIERFEKYVPSGANWSNFYDIDATPDNVTIGDILLVGFVTNLIIIVLIWYLDNVYASGPGVTRPMVYPLMMSYWLPTMSSLKAPPRSAAESLNFEKEPGDLTVVMELIEASKDYGSVQAVSRASLQVYDKHITVLCGHNGAGKTTTMNMITGFIKPSLGNVVIRKYDIVASTRKARQSIGYCSQFNILFNDLTVEEHLLVFAVIKGATWGVARTEVNSLLRDIGLVPFRSELAVGLTPGLQRRLCTAMAIILAPKLVVLDEPTAHMDPDSRREMWELLLKFRRRDCTILLTTQYLDEAEILGDRIAIMANGRIRSCGSSTFLKQRFGTGYHILVNKMAQCDIYEIEDLLQKYARKARLQSDSANEAVFILGQMVATRLIITMFQELESRKGSLGIESFGVNVTTLEDIMVKFREERHIHRHHHHHHEAGDEAEAVEAKRSHVQAMATSTSARPGCFYRLWGLTAKRAAYATREWKLPLFSWLFPPILLYTLFGLENISTRGGSPMMTASNRIDYTFDVAYFAPLTTIFHNAQDEFVDTYLLPALYDNGAIASKEDGYGSVLGYLLLLSSQSLRAYIFHLQVVYEMDEHNGTTLWYNGQNPHAAILAMHVYNIALLRNLTNDRSAYIQLEIIASSSAAKAEDEDETSRGTYRYVLPKVLRSIFFPMASSLMCSSFIVFPVTERILHFKHLQFMTGVGGLMYWGVNFVWDFTFYAIAAIFLMVPLPAIYAVMPTDYLEAVIVLNLLHGAAALPLIYMLSFVFDNPSFAFSTVAICTFIIAASGSLAATFLHEAAESATGGLLLLLPAIKYLLRLIPSYAYTRGMIKMLEIINENYICSKGGEQLERVCHGSGIAHRHSLQLCCNASYNERMDAIIEPFSASSYSGYYEMCTLAVEGLVLFIILVFVESQLARQLRRISFGQGEKQVGSQSPPKIKNAGPPARKEDSDIAEEDKLAQILRTGYETSPISTAMVVYNLFKTYSYYINPTQVLNGLSFTLRKGECFGLLGVNGAGKTTTFRILTGEVYPSDGDAVIETYSVLRDTQKFQSYLGYCPQRDGVLDMLTGTEALVLFCRLRGISVAAGDYIDILLDSFHLNEIADHLVGTYSAGNRRKLSLCMAIVGLPRVLLLDEPYVGIDATARKRIVNYISALQKESNIAIVLTSHSMSEVEFLCNRIAILGGGKLRCLGSLPHLKQKFGKGFTITVKCYPDKKQDAIYQREVVQVLKAYFPMAQLIHSYEGLLEFRMSDATLPWSEMFTRMAQIKKIFKLQDFYIVDTSLEQIYLSFTRKEAVITGHHGAESPAKATVTPSASGCWSPACVHSSPCSSSRTRPGMDSVVQVSSVVWRLLYAKRMRRRPLVSLIEILIPLVPFIFIEDLKSKTDSSSFVNSIIYPVFTPDMEDIKFDTIYIGPDSDYTRNMCKEIQRAAQGTPIHLIPEESDLVNLFTSPNITDNALGIYFKDRQGSHEGAVSTFMDYMIILSSGIYHFQQRQKENTKSGPSEIQDVISMRVTAVQAVVEMAHVKKYYEMATGQKSEFMPLKVRRRQFPFPTYHEDAENLMFLITLRLYFSFMVPFCVVVARVVDERASGMQGLTRLLGLTRTRFWFGVYAANMCMWLLGCLAILGVMTKVEGESGVPFLFRTDPSIIYYSMVLFSSGYILLAMVISLFFTAASYGTAFAMFLWTATFFAPFIAFHWVKRSVSLYCKMDRKYKLYTATIPIHGLYYIFRISELYKSYDQNFEWQKIYTYALNKDNVNAFELMLSLAAFSIFCPILIWYLEVVLPWTTTAPLPVYFPFMRSYWIPPETEYVPSQESKSDKESEELAEGHFEEEPRHLLLVVETSAICKKYHRKLVVDHVTMRLYQNQVFVLLGHSGSGKSTLAEMLGGLTRPSSGTAVIEGFDLLTQHIDALFNVCICMQKNCLYDELTLQEHLYYFGKMQGLPLDLLTEQTDILVKQLRLTEALKFYPRNMTVSVKRKLCIAMSAIAEPKVLILDEPTAGLDIISRHEVWELIQKLRSSSTILITTQDMEEADVLADRIAIIADGGIRCCGSPAFLKKQFGTGYHLMIKKRQKACNVEAILLVTRSYIGSVQIAADFSGVLRLSLGVSTSEGFVEMFKVLERFQAKLGIIAMTVGVTTMEDVYIKIANEMAEQHICRVKENSEDTTSSTVPLEEADFQSVIALCNQKAPRASVVQQTRALLTKRLQYTYKQWHLPVVGIVFPCLIFLSQRVLRTTTKTQSSTDTEVDYSLTHLYEDTRKWKAIMSTDDSMSLLAKRSYLTLIEEKAYDVINIRDIPEYLIELGSQDMNQYTQFLVGAQFYNSSTDGMVAVAWYSGEAFHTAVISMNLVHTALLRNVGNEANTDIKVTVRIAPTTASVSHVFDVHSDQATQNLMIQITLFSASLAIMTTTYGIFPVVDRVTQSKHLQLMTGLSSRTYWFANFIFDYLFYMLAVGGMVPVFAFLFPKFTKRMISSIVFIFMAYGACTIPLTYILSFMTQSKATMFCLICAATFFSSGLTAALFILKDTLETSGWKRIAAWIDSVTPIMNLNPPYALVHSFLSSAKYMMIRTLCESHITEEYRYICVREGTTSTAQDVELKSEFASECCPHFNSPKNNRTRIPVIESQFNMSSSTSYMIAEAVLFFAVLTYFDSGSFGQLRTYVRTKVSRKQAAAGEVDEDVKGEEDRARDLVTSRKFDAEMMGVLELSKKHRKQYVVSNISFVVKHGEILGILGGYGAGKTTVFRLLTGDLSADKGQALINTPNGVTSLRGSIRDWKSNIGYCPEHDGFLEQLSAWEMMLLFARLRGIPERIISQVVIQFLRIVDLEKIMYDQIETYNGGSKRKLSLGLALIGLPPIVILDEPTTGVDVLSRQKLWHSLRSLQTYANTAIIMSSHSIEECEELCERIIIMMDGQIQCIGTIPHLKAKFAQGYTLTVKTHMEYREDEDYMKKVLKTIESTFPAIKLQESYEGHLEYHLPNIGLTWSQMFSMVEFLRKKLNLLDLLLRNTTLDQIYVTLAKKEEGRRIEFDEDYEEVGEEVN
ncbi:uncharacterized protein LOC135390539 [Ornithodoros turicata]|uniref:uncharacterized protein LOC135390539 n=1 Tax=Ornithodoros turicata TaxID=34597 RepID=UPI003138DD99